MVSNALRALWAEPRPAHAPSRVWRDWALVALVVSWSVVETLLGQDRRLAFIPGEFNLAWRPIVLTVGVVIALTLLWRRTHPLGAVAAAFGTLTAVDVARILSADDTGLLSSTAAAVLLPYALFRWGAGREAAIGLGLILVWLGVTQVADPVSAVEVAGAFAYFLFSAALGAAIRYHAAARVRDIEQAKLPQRNELARELHDTVAHHVSGIAIQAIEEAAARTLEEMRAMVGVLRDGTEPDFAPQPGVAAIEQLARSDGGWPRVDVQLPGDPVDVNASVGAALYRIAQEAVTNAVRHARNATRVVVHVVDEDGQVRLTVRDDGDASATGHTPPGYGLVGMAERASLLGGTLQAGPDPDGGWTVDAVLPKEVTTT